MNYLDIIESTVDGEGIRVVLWIGGCSHVCLGCHNKASWDYKAGSLFTQDVEQKLYKMLNKSYIQGVTLSGGDPLADKNWKEVLTLLQRIKLHFPTKDVWLYTGYTLEEICCTEKKEVLECVDVLVDGRFELELKDSSLLWRGSNNQRILKRGFDF